MTGYGGGAGVEPVRGAKVSFRMGRVVFVG